MRSPCLSCVASACRQAPGTAFTPWLFAATVHLSRAQDKNPQAPSASCMHGERNLKRPQATRRWQSGLCFRFQGVLAGGWCWGGEEGSDKGTEEVLCLEETLRVSVPRPFRNPSGARPVPFQGRFSILSLTLASAVLWQGARSASRSREKTEATHCHSCYVWIWSVPAQPRRITHQKIIMSKNVQ